MSEAQVIGVLVTYRRPADLARCLQVLSQQERRLDRVIVVNNDPRGSIAGVVRDHEDAAVRCDVVDTHDNLGPAGGIAVGMQAALDGAGDDDMVMVLDDDDPLVDDRVVSDLTRAMVDARLNRPQVAGVGLRGSLLNRSTGRLSPAECPADGHVAVDYLKSDWAPAYLVSAIRDVGEFRSDLFFGFDDLEFGLRMNEHGHTIEMHELGRPPQPVPPAPAMGFRRTPWRTYYTVRNLLVILRRYASVRAFVRMAVVLGMAKPAFNMVKSPRGSWVQVRMSWRALLDAVLRRMARTVEPDESKFSDS